MQLNTTVEILGKQEPIINGYRFRKAYPSREERARVLVEQGMVHPQDGGCYQGRFWGHFWVESLSAHFQGQRGQGHMVCLEDERASCTCPDWADRLASKGHDCQHIMAARLLVEQAEQAAVPALAVA